MPQAAVSTWEFGPLADGDVPVPMPRVLRLDKDGVRPHDDAKELLDAALDVRIEQQQRQRLRRL